MVHARNIFVALGLLATTACGFGAREQLALAPISDAPTWDTNIEPLMRARCNSCHGPVPQEGAPDYLRTDIYDDDGGTQGARSLAHRHAVRAASSSRPMPPTSSAAMSDEEIRMLVRWDELGAPRTAADLGGLRCAPGSIAPCACRSGLWGVQTCNSAGTYDRCGCGDDDAGGADVGIPDVPLDDVVDDVGVPLTLDSLHAEILLPRCATSGCHDADESASPDLATAAGLRDRLLGPSAQVPGLSLVVPGNPGSSYLYLKGRDDFETLGFGSGERMPPPPEAALGADLRRIVLWIQQGAP
jgi:hypothetical protein